MLWPSPITAYVGVNGSGKSLSAIAMAVTDYKRLERPLITNMVGLSIPHHYFESVEEVPDILASLGTSNLIIDEAGAMFASRDAGRNKAFERTVQQLRKHDSRLMWTAPAFARADKILREVTFTVILCRSLWKKREPGKVWPSTRLIHQKSFDVSRFDTSGMTINRNAKAKGMGLVRTAKWETAFDSFARVAGEPQPHRPGQTPDTPEHVYADVPSPMETTMTMPVIPAMPPPEIHLPPRRSHRARR